MVEVGDGDSLVLSFLLSHSFQIVFKEHVLLLQGLPRWLRGKESACGRCGFGPWVGKTPGGGNGKPLQYSCLWTEVPGGLPSLGLQRVRTRLKRLSRSTMAFIMRKINNSVRRGAVWKGVRKRLCALTQT